VVVDTGVFSAGIGGKRRPSYEPLVTRMIGNQVFLAHRPLRAPLRSARGRLGQPRHQRLEVAIAATTVIPVSDALVTAVAELRFACRQVGHPLADRTHANDLWIAASAVHIGAAVLSADNVFSGVRDSPSCEAGPERGTGSGQGRGAIRGAKWSQQVVSGPYWGRE